MEALSSTESDNSSPLVLLAHFLNRIKASEEQINIPTHIHDAVRQDLNAPQYFPAAEISLVIEALDSSEPSLCSRLTSQAFIVIFAIFRASEPSWAVSRGLCLLTESIFEPKPDDSTSPSALRDNGGLHLTARKARIGAEILPLLLSKLCKLHAMGGVRRWTGLLALELMRNSPENQKSLELGPENIRLQLGQLVMHETNEVLRLIAWSIVRELVSNGASQGIFWPGDSNAITHLRYFNTEQHEYPWLKSFQLYSDSLHLQREISYKQTVFSVSGLQLGVKEYLAGGYAVILVPAERLLTVVLPNNGSEYTKLVDVPLENIRRTTLQESSTTGEVSSIRIKWDIHLAQGTHNTVYVNGMGCSVSVVSILFSDMKTVKNLEHSILALGSIERETLFRFSYALPQDISEKDSGISVGPDDYSNTAGYSDLMKVAIEAGNLVQVQSKERTSKVDRVASIQSPIFASIEVEVNDKSIVHFDQQRKSREHLELGIQHTVISDPNDLILSAEDPRQDHKAIIAPSSSKLLGQLSERQKLDSIIAQSMISYAMIKQGSRKARKICQRMYDRQGQPAKTEALQESSEEKNMNSKGANNFHVAHQKKPRELKAMIDRPCRKEDSERKVSSSIDMGSVIDADYSLFDIPESPKEAHEAQTKSNLRMKLVTNARSSLQDPVSGRKVKQYHVSRTRDKGKKYEQTGSTDLVKLSSHSNILDSSDSPIGDLTLFAKHSDKTVPKTRLKAKGVPKKDLGQQRPTKNLGGNRKKLTRQRKPATTAICRPVSKRRAAVQATMKIRGVALNENTPTQVSPQQTTVPDLSFTRASNTELDAKEESRMATSSPKGAAVSDEMEPELQVIQENLETQPSTPSPLDDPIEMEAGDQPLEGFSVTLLPMDLSRCSEESRKTLDDHHHESTMLVSPNNDDSWKPLESATSPEALNRQFFQTVCDPSHYVGHAEVSDIAGLTGRTTLYAEEKPLNVRKGVLLESLSDTAPERHKDDLGEEANRHFEDAMTFIDVKDPVASMQSLQHSKQQEEATEYTMIPTPEPRKILLRHTDFVINGRQSLSATDAMSERSGKSSKDLIDPFVSKKRATKSDCVADIPQAQVLEGDCHPHVKQEKIPDISKIGISSLTVLEQNILEQGVGMNLEDGKDVSGLLTTSHQISTSPALQKAPEAVMVSSEIMAERDRLARARVVAKSQLTNVIDISSNEEVEDDSIECSESEVSEKSKIIVLGAKKRGKHTLEEVDHPASKRFKLLQLAQSPVVLGIKDPGESVSLSSTKEHSLRKSTIISFSANGPRNQGVLSSHTFTKSNLTLKQDSNEKAIKTELSRKRKSFSKLSADLDHTPVLLRVKRSKVLKISTPEDRISPSTTGQNFLRKMPSSKNQDSTPPISKSLSPTMDVFMMDLDDSLSDTEQSQTAPALPPNATPSVILPGRGSTTPFPNVPRPTRSAPALCSNTLSFPKVPPPMFPSFPPSTITSDLKSYSELQALQALEAPSLSSQSQSLAPSVPVGLQTPTPRTPWERPALNPPASNGPRLRTQQAAATGRKTSTMKGMKINFDGSPVPKGHPSLVYHERQPAASRQGEAADSEERANGSGKKYLLPSSALGKRLPSSPTAPSRMLEDLDAHAIHPDGRLINIRTAKFVRAADLEDPFTGEVDEWTAYANPVHQKMLAKVLPDKETASPEPSFRGEDHGEGPSTGELLGAWGAIPQDKKTSPSDPSSSSSPSQPLEDESPEEVTREWREELESHQKAMLEALQDVANFLVKELVDEELAVNNGTVLEYRRQARKMITDLRAAHKHDHDAQRVRVERVANGLVESLGGTKGMLEGVARKMKEERVRVRELARRSRVENQGVLDRLDAL